MEKEILTEVCGAVRFRRMKFGGVWIGMVLIGPVKGRVSMHEAGTGGHVT